MDCIVCLTNKERIVAYNGYKAEDYRSKSRYAIFFDNVRVDQFVKGFSVNLQIDGSIGQANIEMIYVPDFYKITHDFNNILVSRGTETSTSGGTTSQTSSPSTINFSSWPVLKKGSKGEYVKELQKVLMDMGYSEVTWIDGIFGSKTQSAVYRFQRDNSLKYIDGIVGSETKTAMQRAYKPTSGTNSKTTATASTGLSYINDDGIENMTNVKIFIKNMFNGLYVQVFDGNIRAKTLTKSGGEYTLSFIAYDYVNWLNRTIAPIAIPLDSSLTNGDLLKWKAQGIDPSKVKSKPTMSDINFKGKSIAEMWSDITANTIRGNNLYTDPNSVAAWDNAINRVKIMGDIAENLRDAQVIDFMINNSATSANSIYVLMNDTMKTILFEFYQDRDGIIRIKPPFWNENILTNHVIDSSLIISYTESTNWNNYYTRVIATGGLEEWEQEAANESYLTRAILTPVAVATSAGTQANSGVGALPEQMENMEHLW